MADAYWKFGDSRQQATVPPLVGKRRRSDYVPNFVDVPGGHKMSSYYARDDERGSHHVIRDIDSINASYDQYLRSVLTSYGGDENARPMSGGHSGCPVDDPRIMSIGGLEPAVTAKGHAMGLGVMDLNFLYLLMLAVLSLWRASLQTVHADICRPFDGYKEVRLVTKGSRHSGGDPLVHCFVDFASPAHAATAMYALQGYKFDEHDCDSISLRLQFARYPGARSGGRHRGKH